MAASSAPADHIIPCAAPRMALWKFTARWCGPCKAIQPSWRALAAEVQSRIAFVDIDVERYAAIAKQHRVNSIPTFMLWSGDTPPRLLKRWTDGDATVLCDTVMGAFRRAGK